MALDHRGIDPAFMDEALDLARRSRPSPNPRVGAVLVKGGRIVGRGHHVAPGEPHAEMNALADAGAAAEGADLYVTLEPCCHYGRTGPCTVRIQAANLGRVIVGIVDPDPRVSGRGIAFLEDAGHEVVLGVREQECRRLLAGYWMHRVHGRPLVTLKAAITLDGRIATTEGHSRWISGEASRVRAHELRADSDAVLVGLGTVLADDPLLTVRQVSGRNPLRVVVDSRLGTPPRARLIATAAEVPVLLAHTISGRPAVGGLCGINGVELLECPATDHGRVDLAWLVERLAARGVLSLLVEGGATVHGAFVTAGLADRAVLFVAPRLFGSGPSWLAFDGSGTVESGPVLEGLEAEPSGTDLIVRARFPGSPAIGI
ncbi:MAG TPA: bifunctional diaminohydroxyphosphoribosylaminopyrimidine deaminase/5-amino-6-(5-phosphoribosylamino)uracil reductase RibD [Polyangia bacterium]|nr:bifunctional diaminohydroxyphosphoribosylaminopyrimidine deaminase/5-amino-6-(5-phosphoribosylamino)uracil reductase RibD [Polyangia bacterium]